MINIMSLTDKIFETSNIILNGGYINPDLNLAIWLLEKCNCIHAKQKLAELYIEKKYKTTHKNIINILNQNIQVNDIYSKFLLAQIFIINNKFEYAYNLLNYDLLLNEYCEIQTKKYVKNLIFYMGLYELDKKNNIELGKKYLKYFFDEEDIKTGILDYILYIYLNEDTLDKSYQNADLYSCYLLAKQTNNVLYYNEYIDRYDIEFYNKYINSSIEFKHIPPKNLLKKIYNEAKIYILCNKIIDNNKKVNSNTRKYIQEYAEQNNILDTNLNYILAITAQIVKLNPSKLYFDKMYKCYHENYMDSKYYLALMYYNNYGIEKNNKLSIELLDLYINNENINNKNAIHLLVKIYYDEKNYTNIIGLEKTFLKNQDKMNNKSVGECYYILSLVYFHDEFKNIKNAIHYLKQSLKYDYLDAYFKMGTLLFDGHYIKKNNKTALEHFIYAGNNKHYNSLSNVAYFYYNGIEIDKNVKFALELWERLAENNNDNALYYLGEHYKNINDKKYILYIKKSAEMNNSNALYSLSQFYKEINKHDDYIKCLKCSIENGNKDALEELYKESISYKDKDNNKIYLSLLEFCANKKYKNAEIDLNDYNELQHLRNI